MTRIKKSTVVRTSSGRIITTCEFCSKLPWTIGATQQRCLCSGFNLDIGCGTKKQPGYVGMDKRDVQSVDIVWDIESVIDPPFYAKRLGAKSELWPFKDNTVDMLLVSHVLEHIKPWGMIDIFNEMWRVVKPVSQVFIGVPHGLSSGQIQDPTHISPFNEATFQYFVPENDVLYPIYQPKPWKIERMSSHPMYNMEVVLSPIKK